VPRGADRPDRAKRKRVDRSRSLHDTLERVPAASGAVVVVTGLVSLALSLDGQTNARSHLARHRSP